MFFSNLTQKHCDEETYLVCKQLYEYRLNLPDNHKDKWFNMSCYLKHYNLLDVAPLKEALRTCFKSFKNYFMVDPGNKIKEKATLTLKYSNEIELTIDSVSKHDESCGPATAAYCIVCKRDKQIQTWGTSSTIISSINYRRYY